LTQSNISTPNKSNRIQQTIKNKESYKLSHKSNRIQQTTHISYYKN